MPHVPPYSRELVALRRVGLRPVGAFVTVTNCWRLAKLVRAAGSAVLVVRDRDEPDLRGCYGLKVLVTLAQCEMLESAAHLVKTRRTLDEYLAALHMVEGPRHELEALEALVRPIAAACAAARVDRAVVDSYSLSTRIWTLSAQQAARQKAAKVPE